MRAPSGVPLGVKPAANAIFLNCSTDTPTRAGEVRRVDARAREEQARVHRVLHVLRLEDRDDVRDGQAHVEQLLRDGTPVFGVGRRGIEQPRGFQLFEHGDEATPLCETAVVRDQPSGVVTFLFTDVEGSTRLWAEHTAVDGSSGRRAMTSYCAP